jgi:hypothetical protein
MRLLSALDPDVGGVECHIEKTPIALLELGIIEAGCVFNPEFDSAPASSPVLSQPPQAPTRRAL